MVLYGKSGNFIGIGKEELSFLGFDDIDEFKNEYKDFADLFVNKPGYIFNFKNFSWIDYTLHSGAPKKSVILKLKNGQEVETNLKINELFLKNPTDKEDIYYCVEILNTSMKTSYQQVLQEEPSPNINIQTSFTPPPVAVELPKEIAISEYIPEVSLQEEVITQPSSSNEPISFDISEDFNDTSNTADVKLKFDQDILEETIIKKTEEPLVEESIDLKIDESFDIPMNLTPQEDNFKLKIDFDEPKIEDEIKPEKQVEEEIINFDIVDCAENLGLDLGEIAQILEDFIEKTDTNLDILKNCIEIKDINCIKEVVLKLKGISDTLQINQFSNHLSTILKSNDIATIEDTLNSFEKLVIQLKKELL